MLASTEIDRLVHEATRRVVPFQALASVKSEPAIDSDGEDALRIVLTFAGDHNPATEGDVGLETLVGIRQALVRAGEGRFPIVDFTTEQEEAVSGDPES